MIIPTLLVAGLSTLPGLTLARPTAEKRWAYQKYFDLQVSLIFSTSLVIPEKLIASMFISERDIAVLEAFVISSLPRHRQRC